MQRKFIAFITVLLATGTAHTGAQPNIILLISDDAGFADFGFMDQVTGIISPVPTPNLDSLRARGVLCTNAYTASVCSPSRAAIVTGNYQQRTGYEFNINNITSADSPHEGLPSNAVTIFERMGNLGYTTGVIGKWHLGARPDIITNGTISVAGNRPPRQGVDEFYGILKGSRSYDVGNTSGAGILRELELNAQGFERDEILESAHAGENVTNTFGQGAVDFIRSHHSDVNPFFLYVSFTTPHGPIHNSPDFNDPRIAALGGKRRQYASMVLTMDKEIGRILHRLDDPNGDNDNSDAITDNTLVIFINDNGGARNNGTVNTPLRNWKGSPFEGGVRIPMIMAGAGIAPQQRGTTYTAPVHTIDLAATAVITGGGNFDNNDPIDGVNLLPYINNEKAGIPHQYIIMRSAAEVGIRHENWKLVRNGRNQPYQLFNLDADISETTNVSANNPQLVTTLQEQLTRFEAGVYKPRFPGLNQPESSINRFDHFRLSPSPGNAPPVEGENLLENPGFEDGSAIDADSRHTFAELNAWSNNGNAASTQFAALNNNANSGTYRGMLLRNTRIPYQITKHSITEGNIINLDFFHRGFSGWDAADTFSVELFYLDALGTEQILSILTIAPTPGAWNRTSHSFPRINSQAAVGRQLGIRFRSNAAGSEFASLDNVSLKLIDAGPNDEADNTSSLEWSENNAWIDPVTGREETMFDMDAFAGATLEFPVKNTFNYIAINDMTRMTGLEFMLNQIVFSGNHDGNNARKSTLSGKALLLVDHLETGTRPTVQITANGPAFSFELKNELVLFDDLVIAGEGTSDVIISGRIRDYLEPRAVIKSGSSSLRLEGLHNYAGATIIEDGTLHLEHASLVTSPMLTVHRGAQLQGTGELAGSLQIEGKISLRINDDFNDRIDSAQNISIKSGSLEIMTPGKGATRPLYVLLSYNELNGNFSSISGIPPGYSLHYSYDTGSANRCIALIRDNTLATNQVLISKDRLNGGFEQVTESHAGESTFEQVAQWTNYLRDTTLIASTESMPLPGTGGTHSAFLSEDGTRVLAIDTGYRLRTEEHVDMSFHWRDAENWNDTKDTLKITQFITADDTLDTPATTINEFSTGTSRRNNSYQKEKFYSPPIPASANGKRLFLRISTTELDAINPGYCRIDNISLTVLTTNPYARWTYLADLVGDNASPNLDANGDGTVNAIAFAMGLPDPFTATDTPPLTLEYHPSGSLITLSYPQIDASLYASLSLEYSDDLETWVEARAGIDGITITREDLGERDIVHVTLPLPNPPLRQIFTRLSLSGL